MLNIKSVDISQISKNDVDIFFGNCKYSCKLTEESSWFHTIITENVNIYIEEWFLEINGKFVAVIFKNNKIINITKSNLDILLNEIKIILNE